MSALTKPLFPLASSIGLVMVARFSDRIGKGIRGSPRDALLADVTPQDKLGAAYGLRQSLDTVGAIAGPLLASVLLLVFAENLRAALWYAVFPAAVAVLVIVFFVREPSKPQTGVATGSRIAPTLKHLGALGTGTWIATIIASVITLARFSEAFLLLRAGSLGVPAPAVPMVLAGMNVTYALSSYPSGALSDRLGRSGVLIAGIAVLIAADVALAIATGWIVLGFGVALWGLHMGLTQGLLSAMVADAAPAELRGAAFGAFNLASGLALLLASLIAGLMWDAIGPSAPFTAGAVVAAVSLGALLLYRR